MRASCLLLALSLSTAGVAQAQTLTVTGAGSTFIVNFTSGYTQARADAMRRAAQVWADALQSPVAIEVDISFVVLSCDANEAVLGQAGPTTASRSFPNAPVANTWYPIALANAVAGNDLNGGTAEIDTEFNSALDDPARDQTCLRGVDWYYGTGAPPAGTIGFFDVVLHEIAHGLGFLSYANPSTGALLQGFDDHFTRLLEDDSAGRRLTAADANDAQRQAAFTDTGDLVWTGQAVTTAGAGLTAGRVSSGQVRMYAPPTVQLGSSVSHFDLILDPNELMEPSYTNLPDRDLTVALFQDIGWNLANTSPIITGTTRTLSTLEDTPITLALGDLAVTDPDSNYPADFTLIVENSANYSVAGAVVTPAANFSGNLLVPVRVNDGNTDSATFTATVAVTPVNDAPAITAQANLQTNEDTALTLSVADFTVTDPDSSAFTVTVGSGPNYTVSGLVLTPAPDFFGTLSVPVTPNDGAVDGAPYVATITVTPVNDPPVITAAPGPLNTNEDVPVTVPIAGFTVTDPDDSFPADFTVEVAPGMGFTAVGAVVTPDLNTTGTLTLSVAINDGEATSNALPVTVNVAPVNDPPIIVGPAQLSFDEDDTLPLSAADFMIQDPDSPASSFAVRVEAGTNYTVLGGDTVRPALDFFGTLMVAVVPSDGAADGPTYVLPVVVNPIPDAPRVIGQMPLIMDEDTPITLTLADFEVLDPDSPPSTFTLQVISGPEYTFSGNTVTPRQDLDGVLYVRVVVRDDALESTPFTAEIDVRAINDPPRIVGQEPLALRENQSLTLELDDLVIVDPDSETFTLQVMDGMGFTRSGATITPTGPGMITVPVTVSDGQLTSPVYDVEVSAGENIVSPPIALDAAGLYTRVMPPPPPESLGILTGPVTVTLAQGLGEWLRPGRYEILWRETDGQNEATARQAVLVRPVVALSSNRRVTEGSVSDMSLVLNGPNPQAGFQVAYLVEGTAEEADHDLRARSVTVLADVVDLPIPIRTIDDGISEPDETIQVTLTGDGNLLNGATHQTVITDGPTAPRLAIRAAVDGSASTTYVRGGASMVLTVEGDATGATLTWRYPTGVMASGTPEQQTLDLSALAEGGYTVELEAGSPGGTTRSQLSFRVLESGPTLSDMLDTDGDGAADAVEGFGDADADGVPDYLDPFRIAFALPLTPGFEPPAVVESRPGARLVLGPVAIGAGADGAGVEAADIAAAAEVTPDTVPFTAALDVIAPDLVPGDSALFAFTVPSGFPADGQLRIWGPNGWQDFVPGTGERVESAADIGTCWAPTSDAYRAPQIGHRCLRVSVRDGGPNDRDGQADGRVWVLAALGVRTGGGAVDAGSPADGGATGGADGGATARDGGSGSSLGPAPDLSGGGCRASNGGGGALLLLGLGLWAGRRRRRR